MPSTPKAQFDAAQLEQIHRDIADIGPANTAAKWHVSRTVIYRIKQGIYPYKTRAELAAAGEVKAPRRRRGSCPGCGLPTGVPCPVCAARETAEAS